MVYRSQSWVTMLLYNGFGNMFEFTFFLPWKEIIACVIGVYVIIFITMLHASSKLKHENIIDALKEEKPVGNWAEEAERRSFCFLSRVTRV